MKDLPAWKQYVYEFNPKTTTGIRNIGSQTFEVINPSVPIVERSMVTIYELAVLYMLAKD